MRYVKKWLIAATVYFVIIVVVSIIMVFEGHTSVLAQIVNLCEYFLGVIFTSLLILQ